jgi:FdrA protein
MQRTESLIVLKAEPNPTATMPELRPKPLLGVPLNVINIGLEGFAKELEGLRVPVMHVAWKPPAGGDVKLADLLSKLGT